MTPPTGLPYPTTSPFYDLPVDAQHVGVYVGKKPESRQELLVESCCQSADL